MNTGTGSWGFGCPLSIERLFEYLSRASRKPLMPLWWSGLLLPRAADRVRPGM